MGLTVETAEKNTSVMSTRTVAHMLFENIGGERSYAATVFRNGQGDVYDNQFDPDDILASYDEALDNYSDMLLEDTDIDLLYSQYGLSGSSGLVQNTARGRVWSSIDFGKKSRGIFHEAVRDCIKANLGALFRATEQDIPVKLDKLTAAVTQSGVDLKTEIADHYRSKFADWIKSNGRDKLAERFLRITQDIHLTEIVELKQTEITIASENAKLLVTRNKLVGIMALSELLQERMSDYANLVDSSVEGADLAWREVNAECAIHAGIPGLRVGQLSDAGVRKFLSLYLTENEQSDLLKLLNTEDMNSFVFFKLSAYLQKRVFITSTELIGNNNPDLDLQLALLLADLQKLNELVAKLPYREYQTSINQVLTVVQKIITPGPIDPRWYENDHQADDDDSAAPEAERLQQIS